MKLRAFFAAAALWLLAAGNDTFYHGKPPDRVHLYTACALVVIGLAPDRRDTDGKQ